MMSRTCNVGVNIEDDGVEAAINKFANLLWEAHNNQEAPSAEEPPVLYCNRLEQIARMNELLSADMYSGAYEDDFRPRILEKPKVCRRINFNHPDDRERVVKEETIIMMTMPNRSTHSQHEENKKSETLVIRKRRREDDEMEKVVTKRAATKAYTRKMR